MKSFDVVPQGVCAKKISFDIDEAGKLHDVHFTGGCPGNTAAIGKLIEGSDAKKVADILRGNLCGAKPTSCADQLAHAIDNALAS
ncbi:MAG: TIGR03905 family TSCPD domain-containing protein [Selenomonadaceae bacterium]